MCNQIDFLHAFRSQDSRKIVMEKFREGSIKILCTTEAAGMGLDIADITRIVQFMVPPSLSVWVQRYGHVVRSGGAGIAVLLVEPSVYKIKGKKTTVPGGAQDLVVEHNEGGRVSEYGSPKSSEYGDLETTNAESDTSTSSQDGSSVSESGVSSDESEFDCEDNEESESPHTCTHGAEVNELRTSDEPTKKTVTYAKMVESGMRRWIETEICRRKVANIYFANPLSEVELTVPCCDVCLFNKEHSEAASLSASEQAMLTKLKCIQKCILGYALDVAMVGAEAEHIEESSGKTKRPRAPWRMGDRRGPRLKGCKQALKKWRSQAWRTHYQHSSWDEDTLLPDTVLNKLSSKARLQTIEEVRIEVPKWVFTEKHWEDVRSVLKSLDGAHWSRVDVASGEKAAKHRKISEENRMRRDEERLAAKRATTARHRQAQAQAPIPDWQLQWEAWEAWQAHAAAQSAAPWIDSADSMASSSAYIQHTGTVTMPSHLQTDGDQPPAMPGLLPEPGY
ncbi:hypothetical protein WOLCODRAFT_19348 [Wolfiporia cocos MD-104 SS10]|uniref:RNA helicase n=1 Tax=Wolfiporia cocos (strain MD-104) TaxID=742152 RepID=A0A2H3K7L8_WOLCO|nr:hypothetical protein WOLCODRAFT_19348 [Wolfiporia cocos MD-104 SS10]